MPLPIGGKICWPPADCGPINNQIATWAAWYSASADQLTAIYGGSGGSATSNAFFGSESGTAKNAVGRAVETLRRWFWGSRNTAGQPRNRLHVPIAGDIAAASAGLLFSEPPKVKVEDETTQKRLDELLDDGAHATWLEAAEIAAALGGVYLRTCWDPATRPDGPWIGAVHPDAAVPEWSFSKLQAVTFWRVIERSKQSVVRHLERHEIGKVIHGVYDGTEDELGHPAPFADYAETAWLADQELVNGNEILTGLTILTADYIPNMKPNRVWRNTPGAAPLGRSDYAGVEPLMDALDMTYSSWMRDVELGKARLVVPAEYMTSHGAGQGASFELDREIYEGVSGILGSDEGSMSIEQVQFKIRVDEHQQTIAALKGDIVSAAGYSGETFGLAAEGSAQTATEVNSKNQRSLITRDHKIRYFRPGLMNQVEALLGIDAGMFHTPGIKPQRPTIEFAPGVSDDPDKQSHTILQLDQASAISIEQKVKTLHPDWPQDQIDAEVELIKDEKGLNAVIDDPTAFDGGGGFNTPSAPKPDPAADESA